MKPEKKPLITRGIEGEPQVGSGEIPVIFFGILAGLVFCSLLYLDKYAGGFNNLVYRPYDSYKEVEGLQPTDPEAKRRMLGKKNYELACQICHQPTGLGVPTQFPPLDGSEWVNGPVPRLIRIPLVGLAGPIEIKGQHWEAAMPNAGAVFTNDEDLAALLTYIRSAWSNKSGPVTAEEVAKARAKDGARAQPWTAADLLKVPEKE
jgi:mono/diheme cytochrome c family protein